jgi:hypothetical protein
MGIPSIQNDEQPCKQEQGFLPRNVDRAVEVLIALSQDMLHLTYEEHESLITLDHMRFAYAQREKDSLSQRYSQASEEFRGRLGAFRMADRALIADLNGLQTEIKNITERNNLLIDDIKRQTQATTQSSLFIAQEMGQRAAVKAKAANSNDAYSRAANLETRGAEARGQRGN